MIGGIIYFLVVICFETFTPGLNEFLRLCLSDLREIVDYDPSLLCWIPELDLMHAILALNDAIAAAIAANTPNPNFTTVIGQLSDAVASIVQIVQSFMSSAAPAVAAHTRTAGGVDAVADMSLASTKLKALTLKK